MIVSINDIENICNEIRSKGNKIVFTNGCFDLIHIGHVRYLTEAKKLGDVLIVGLNSDDSVRRLKGSNRPITPQEERAEILDALKPVNIVVVFEEDTPIELIKKVRPNVLVKGGDYTLEQIVGADFVKSTGGEVIVIPYVKDKSTTNLIEKLKHM
ncbi:D-glycero-beta-D-manno-heptose 1-phosphate adenylyltransferase [Bacteroidetes/Chlorobi group bacterium Naka2016]|jgi:rfaE bifunctional protein nucleotidyltransferase chain/domain|nr:MAG: D-glycero-beta-D-manno-heptose 1-phosphate adenylyltransferase [Bacteroidetes/Chlorobi group bacterium Naka2016]